MTTRAALRREIGLRLGQPFFRRLAGATGYGTASANGTTTTLIDTAWLKEEDHYWRGDYIYLPESGVEREISAFANATSTLTWLAATSATYTASGKQYELWSQFTATEVNTALNMALRQAWPYLFLAAHDETIPIVSDAGLIYTLPTTHTIRRLYHVYLKIYDSITGTVTTLGTTTQVLDTSASFTSADVGKYISIYEDGSTALGNVRQVTACVSSTELTVGVAFSVALPVGAKYRLIDKTTETPRQVSVTNYIPDSYTTPTTIWLGSHPAGYEGHLFDFHYEYEFPALATETADTTCPIEFVVPMAIANLYGLKLTSSAATEQQVWSALQKMAAVQAQDYAINHRWRHAPAQFIRHDLDAYAVPYGYPFLR